MTHILVHPGLGFSGAKDLSTKIGHSKAVGQPKTFPFTGLQREVLEVFDSNVTWFSLYRVCALYQRSQSRKDWSLLLRVTM